MLHYFTNVLRVLPGRDQQRIWSFNHYQIAHSNSRHELARRVNVVAPSIQNEYARAIDQVAFSRTALRRVMLVQRGP